MQSINIRLVKVHGFMPVKLMFGYKPVMDRSLRYSATEVEDPEDYAPHLHRLHMEGREELRKEAQ
jgi:hypothetical protein